MTALYRDFLTREELDAAYDNTRAVADSARILVGFEERSRLLAERYPGELNLRFGPRERQRIDFFRVGSPGAPLLVFIHGGYWQMRRKETFRFLAAGALHHGISVALPGYTLAPEQNLAGIVTEIRDALRWLREHADSLGFDRSRSSSQAGRRADISRPWRPTNRRNRVLAISGIFDLEPIRLCYLNDKLLLKPEEVAGLSPLRLPLSEKPLFAVCGSDELPELQRQSWDFARIGGGETSRRRVHAGRAQPLHDS